MKLSKIWAAAAAASIASAGIAYSAPGARAEAPALQVADVTTTSTSAQVTSMVTIAGAWKANTPQAGSAFTVTLPDALAWPAQATAGFPLKVNGKPVGTCTANAQALTCTADERITEFKTVTDGRFDAWARIQRSARGTTGARADADADHCPGTAGAPRQDRRNRQRAASGDRRDHGRRGSWPARPPTP